MAKKGAKPNAAARPNAVARRVFLFLVRDEPWIQMFTYEQGLLVSVGAVLWVFAFCVVNYVPVENCSVGRFIHKNTTRQACALFSVIVMLFVLFALSKKSLPPRLDLNPYPRFKIILTAAFVTFSLLACEVFQDWWSFGLGLSLSVFTIPFCRLLRFVDDIGLMECSVGMSVAAIVNKLGKTNAHTWFSVFAYVLAMLFVKFEIASRVARKESIVRELNVEKGMMFLNKNKADNRGQPKKNKPNYSSM